MTLVINLFAGPGAGKSTTAAGVFHQMKKAGLSVELVTEYAKDRVWEEHYSVFSDQLYLLAKQNRRLRRLIGKVDYVITDSPLLLGQAYATADIDAIKYITTWAFNKYDNLNIFIKRTKPYDTRGRNETYDEALEVDEKVYKLLENYPCKILKDDEHIVEEVLTYLKETINVR